MTLTCMPPTVQDFREAILNTREMVKQLRDEDMTAYKARQAKLHAGWRK